MKKNPLSEINKRTNNKLFLVLSLSLIPSFASCEESMADLITMDLTELENVMVAVATKTNQNIETVPSSVTVFTETEIRSMGIKSVQELLNFVPGFQSTREIVFNPGSMVSARGSSTPQASYNILFMLDGHRLNDVSSGGALIANRHLTTANVKQVEVIRGPGSALYGTGAFSGVVNIITKDRPEKNKNYQFSLAGGNLDRHEFHAQVSKQEKEWGVSLFGQYYDDNGQSYKNVDSDGIEKDQEIYAKLRWQDLRLNLRYSEEELNGFFNTRNHSVENMQQESADLEYDLLDLNDWKLTLHGSFQHISQNSYNESDQQTITLTDNEFNLGFDSRYEFNKDHLLLAGMEWRYATVEGDFIKKSKRDVLGVYIQDQYRFNKQLELTLGLRYDRYSDSGQTINPRFALVYTTDFDATFKLMYGQAFRAPSMRQTSQIRGLGNPTLKSETIKTLEFAWLHTFFNNYHTSLTYFHSWSENKIDTIINRSPQANDINRTFTNIEGTLKTSGIEFELQAQITDAFSVRSSYTHLLSTETNPHRVAQNTFSLIAMYQYNDLNINLNGYYHSEIEQETFNKTNELDDYWLLNANVRYQMTDWLTIVGQGNNLLDERYFSSTKLLNQPEGIPNRGRTYTLGFEVAF